MEGLLSENADVLGQIGQIEAKCRRRWKFWHEELVYKIVRVPPELASAENIPRTLKNKPISDDKQNTPYTLEVQAAPIDENRQEIQDPPPVEHIIAIHTEDGFHQLVPVKSDTDERYLYIPFHMKEAPTKFGRRCRGWKIHMQIVEKGQKIIDLGTRNILGRTQKKEDKEEGQVENVPQTTAQKQQNLSLTFPSEHPNNPPFPSSLLQSGNPSKRRRAPPGMYLSSVTPNQTPAGYPVDVTVCGMLPFNPNLR